MNENWNPDQGFPTPEQVKRMVAAEVKRIAEAECERERGAEEKRESRRDRLRAAYRIQHKAVGRKVDRAAIFFLATSRRSRSPRGADSSRSTWSRWPRREPARISTTSSSW